MPVAEATRLDGLARMLSSMRRAIKTNVTDAQALTYLDKEVRGNPSWQETADEIEAGPALQTMLDEINTDPGIRAGIGRYMMEKVVEEHCSPDRMVIFHADPGVARLLSLTDNEADFPDYRLPFAKLWIEGRFDLKEKVVLGMRLWEDYPDPVRDPRAPSDQASKGINVQAYWEHREPARGAGSVIITHIGHPDRRLGGEFRERIGEAVVTFQAASIDGLERCGFDAGETLELARMVRNWLDLIRGPQVEWAEEPVPRMLQDAFLRRHKAQGLAKAPSRLVHIRIKDAALRRAAEEAGRGDWNPTHRWWVRGHWRTMRAERYRDARGRSVWIAPFLKGSGVLIDKAYVLHAPPGGP